MIIPRVPVQHRRLLPDRRLSGPTPWVIAILMMLTLLAAAAGVGLARAANNIGDAIAGRAEIISFSTDGSAIWYNPLSWFNALRSGRAGTDLRPERSSTAK